jgi:hypothetical protein
MKSAIMRYTHANTIFGIEYRLPFVSDTDLAAVPVAPAPPLVPIGKKRRTEYTNISRARANPGIFIFWGVSIDIGGEGIWGTFAGSPRLIGALPPSILIE